ncbi:Protein transport protein sec9 [Leucoagaricus sp. SymC.cos]|nr:Protein transport protein sec9 [Leucoagaricus sp. SymC.cos]
MPLFKRKDPNQIPPVSAPAPAATPSYTSSSYSGSYRSTSSATYVASRDGDPYSTSYSPSMARTNSQASGYPAEEDTYATDRYARSRGVPDAYARGEANLEQDRNELFAGYKPQQRGAGSGRFFDGPDIRSSSNPGEETEEDIEGIKQQTRFMKEDTVKSSRNALRVAREAEETARNTLGRLGDQSGMFMFPFSKKKLANTERHLDVAKGHSLRAEDKTDELKQLNRSIFRPVIVWNKDAKRAAQEAKILARFEEERDEREKAMMDIRDTQNRVGKAVTYGRNEDEEVIGGGRHQVTAAQQAARKEQRKRYQFEASPSDDEMEDELDENLDEISDMTKRLKALGTAMGQELDQQNARIGRIGEKTNGLDRHIYRNTDRVSRYFPLSVSWIITDSSQQLKRIK